MTIFVDPDQGDDANTGDDHSKPRANPPLFDGNSEWLFAKGSLYDTGDYVNGKPWFLKTPDNESSPWNLRIGSYDRPGENGQPSPIIRCDVDFQHNMTFSDIELEITEIEFHGGFGSALRVGARRFHLNLVNIHHNKLRTFRGKGLTVGCDPSGRLDGCTFSNNETERDPSIPSEDAPAGDGLFFGPGTINCLVEDNLIKDSGHSSINVYANKIDDAPVYGNLIRNNRATGFGSNHCRGISVGGQNGKVFNNVVENQVSLGMTAWDKLNGVGTIYKNCSSDYGITASSTKDVDSVGGVVIGGAYAKIQVIARHSIRTQSPIFINVVDLNKIHVEEQSGGVVEGLRFFNCELNGIVYNRGEILTVEQANLLPQFQLISP